MLSKLELLLCCFRKAKASSSGAASAPGTVGAQWEEKKKASSRKKKKKNMSAGSLSNAEQNEAEKQKRWWANFYASISSSSSPSSSSFSNTQPPPCSSSSCAPTVSASPPPPPTSAGVPLEKADEKKRLLAAPSPFAVFLAERLFPSSFFSQQLSSPIVELGCGNLRDARFLAGLVRDNGNQGACVIAIDQIATTTISSATTAAKTDKLLFYQADFCRLDANDNNEQQEDARPSTGDDQLGGAKGEKAENNSSSNNNNELYERAEKEETREIQEKLRGRFGLVYSRFSLHSVSKPDADRCLLWASKHLEEGGYLCIEARTVEDDFFQRGRQDPSDPDAWIMDEQHYRRFLRMPQLLQQLREECHLQILYSHQSRGLARFLDEDPHVLRVVAVKPFSH
jgi:tellurite methyltransferase